MTRGRLPGRLAALSLLLATPVVAAPGPTATPSPSAATPSPSAATPSPSAATPGVSGATAPPPAPQRMPADHPRPPGRPAESEVSPAADVPAGSIELSLVDGEGAPLPGRAVTLAMQRQSVAEGDSTVETRAVTDAGGRFHFQGLEHGSLSTGFVVTYQDGPARFATPQFTLQENAGVRATLRAFRWTRDINQARVGMRAIVYIEPRDDVLQFEVLFAVFNVGTVAWVPDGITFGAPDGWKAFNAGEGDTRFEESGGALRLTGTYPPGQRDVTLRFQVPHGGAERVALPLRLLPHVAELRVMVEGSRSMTLEVEGTGKRDGRGSSERMVFPAAAPDTNAKGLRVLATSRQLRAGEPELASVAITLGGLPTHGPGRWIAVALALAVAGFGISASLGNKPKKADAERDQSDARRLLLGELVALENAHRAGGVGPKTYARVRAELLDALARLLTD